MSRYRTATLAQRAVKVFVLPSSPQGACSFSKRPHAAGLRIVLTWTAIILQCISPMVLAIMPEMAVAIGCLAAGCGALAARIARSLPFACQRAPDVPYAIRPKISNRRLIAHLATVLDIPWIQNERKYIDDASRPA